MVTNSAEFDGPVEPEAVDEVRTDDSYGDLNPPRRRLARRVSVSAFIVVSVTLGAVLLVNQQEDPPPPVLTAPERQPPIGPTVPAVEFELADQLEVEAFFARQQALLETPVLPSPSERAPLTLDQFTNAQGRSQFHSAELNARRVDGVGLANDDGGGLFGWFGFLHFDFMAGVGQSMSLSWYPIAILLAAIALLLYYGNLLKANIRDALLGDASADDSETAEVQ